MVLLMHHFLFHRKIQNNGKWCDKLIPSPNLYYILFDTILTKYTSLLELQWKTSYHLFLMRGLGSVSFENKIGKSSQWGQFVTSFVMVWNIAERWKVLQMKRHIKHGIGLSNSILRNSIACGYFMVRDVHQRKSRVLIYFALASAIFSHNPVWRHNGPK